ncbi:Protein priB [Grifola frondosa]|uniref:Protein priB n=1 Tax=Grifola frondosa TaxID=5627 RepID=A0A1C7M9D2_GRIFR|nr:Protein priB [Grifola frondosa]
MSQGVSPSGAGDLSQTRTSREEAQYRTAGQSSVPSHADRTSRTSPQSSSTMIGAPPVFYDPSQAVVPEGLDYDQWVATYERNQQQYGYDQPGLAAAQAVQPHQNQYNFVAEYMPPSNDQMSHFDNHFVRSTGDRPQRGIPGRISRRIQQHSDGAAVAAAVNYPVSSHSQISQHIPLSVAADASHTGYQGQQSYTLQQPGSATGSYFYPSVEHDTISSAVEPHQAYNFTHYQPNTDQYSTVATYTPNSDVVTLPSSSTTPSIGGTDDGQSVTYAASSQRPQPAVVTQAHPQPSIGRTPVRKDTGKATRGRGGRQPGKRQRIDDGADSDTQSDEDQLGGMPMNVSMPTRNPDNLPARLPGACKHCKKLKMRCEFPPDENTCRRCRASGHQCIVEGRKPRNAPNKREYLLAQIRQKDAIIQSLLKQVRSLESIHNPYLSTPLSIASYKMATSPTDRNSQNVIAWLERMQASVESAGQSAGAHAFNFESRLHTDDDSDAEDGADMNDPTERGSVGVQQTEDDEPLRDAEDKLYSLPDASVPIGLLANLSLSNDRKTPKKKSAANAGEEESQDDDDVGVANETYFAPGPAYDLKFRASLIQKDSPPEILIHGLVTPDDVEKLFKIYFDRVNVHCDVLDPELHTPKSTFTRCPFLFTVVCAISSRYYPEKSDIYPVAMHFAKHAAAQALLNGWKSVELAQAYILMSLYGVPARRWEEDRSWLYTGLAIRIATDLNLHQVSNVQPKSDRQRRELVNQCRVWLVCYNLDRSTATQFGKPSTIKEDFLIRNSADWYKRSPMNSPFNIGTSAYAQMLRIMSGFHDTINSDPSSRTGLNQQLDFRAVILQYDQQLTDYFEEWTQRFNEDSNLQDPALAFRASLLPFLTGYSRLVMYSFGFQQAFRRGIRAEDQLFLDNCFESAKTVIVSMVDTLAPSGYMRSSPEQYGHFVFASFASAFLLKLIRPEFAKLISRDRETEIFDIIGRLIEKLSSPEIAIDDRHTPKLHARFLAALLAKHRRDVAAAGRLQAQQPPPQSQNQDSHSTVPGTFSSLAGPSAGSSQHFLPSGPASGGLQDSIDGVNGHALAPPPSTLPPAESIFAQDAMYSSNPGTTDLFQFDQPTTGGAGGFDETLGALLALQSPAYWKDMMMPGFSWPESPPAPSEESMSSHSRFELNYPELRATSAVGALQHLPSLAVTSISNIQAHTRPLRLEGIIRLKGCYPLVAIQSQFQDDDATCLLQAGVYI